MGRQTHETTTPRTYSVASDSYTQSCRRALPARAARSAVAARSAAAARRGEPRGWGFFFWIAFLIPTRNAPFYVRDARAYVHTAWDRHTDFHLRLCLLIGQFRSQALATLGGPD